MSGRFITLEGGEGVGKSTQARRLAERLRDRGIAVELTREPGGTAGAEAIRQLLMEGAVDRWSARTEALLFAAARADHVERLVKPALHDGRWVVCDRFVDSTRAYQGLAGGVSDDEIMALHRVGSQGMLPDRTIILHMPVHDAAWRALSRDGPNADRFASREGGFFDRVSKAFLDMAEREPNRIRVIDADGSEDEVTDRAMAALEDLIP